MPLTMRQQYELLRRVNDALRDSGFEVPSGGDNGLLAAYPSGDRSRRSIATVMEVDDHAVHLPLPTGNSVVNVISFDREGSALVRSRPVGAFIREASARKPVTSAFRPAVRAAEQIFKKVVNG